MSKILVRKENKSELEEYLAKNRLISPDGHILSLSKAGDSNMNITLRVEADNRSMIIKQSRPFVAKYPDIPAPESRVNTEAFFYELVAPNVHVRQYLPEMLFKDPQNNLFILEDLGELSSFESMYNGYKISRNQVDKLMNWLEQLHTMPVDSNIRKNHRNVEMRKLNHEHIFSLPLRKENGINLESITKGLETVARKLKEDTDYLLQAEKLGKIYMEDRKFLLHGDFYPASWLSRKDEVYIIDMEFSFFGVREFDYGVFLAHLFLTHQPHDILAQFYADLTVDKRLVEQFAGIEIMRRLIGVAQLPLAYNLDEKTSLLEKSRDLVV